MSEGSHYQGMKMRDKSESDLGCPSVTDQSPGLNITSDCSPAVIILGLRWPDYG